MLAFSEISRMAANILVVEDDSLNGNLICEVLRQEGHGMVEACHGAQALELFCARRFDLVITDFMLPKVNGLKLFEHVHSLRPRIPIIVTTGNMSASAGKAILDDVTEFCRNLLRLTLSGQLFNACSPMDNLSSVSRERTCTTRVRQGCRFIFECFCGRHSTE